jgi:hypothetical protein
MPPLTTLNVAVTVLAEFIVTQQVTPEVASHPLQAAKVDPAVGLAVSVTPVPVE